MPSPYQRPYVGPKHASNRDRTYMLSAPRVPRPAWECNEWWMLRAHELPERVCGRRADHGAATASVESTRLGRTLAYHCYVCGWVGVVLVQEGQDRPTAPASAPPPRVTTQPGARKRHKAHKRRQVTMEGEA